MMSHRWIDQFTCGCQAGGSDVDQRARRLIRDFSNLKDQASSLNRRLASRGTIYFKSSARHSLIDLLEIQIEELVNRRVSFELRRSNDFTRKRLESGGDR